MNMKFPIFIDDEPLVIEMMMNLLSDILGETIPYQVFTDPDEVADLIEAKQLSENHVIVVDRFLYQRDTLELNLPKLFRELGFTSPILIFSYVPIAFEQYGYDDYLKKDLNSVEAFAKWFKL